MLRKRLNAIFLITLIIFVSSSSIGQISYGGLPPSSKFNLEQETVKKIILTAPDVQTLMEEDAFTDKYGIAMRFATMLPVEIDFVKDASWENLPNGGKTCRISIKSEDAQALIVYYQNFEIPRGGQLFLYNKDKSQVIGAFNHNTNPKREAFATEMIEGDVVTLEYFESAGTVERPKIIINEIGYAYRTLENFFRQDEKGNADTCEVNVNCPEGDNWQNEKRGVTRILVKHSGSSVWCTGSLINNVRLDHKPYLLTANHCGPSATAQHYNQWVFYFNYESPGCENPDTTIQANESMVGATKIATVDAYTGSDFKLLRLNEYVPSAYNPYFNGWSAEGQVSSDGVSIHHPQGDLKKISTYTSPLYSTSWDTVPNTHWRVIWAQTQTNWGVTEGGSSGCPIFDNNNRIIGQLTGGQASCSNLNGPDYYGKISWSWDQNQTTNETMLKPWLDPDNTGTMQLDGIFLGIGEKEIRTLNIYPNPSNGKVYVDLSAMNGQAFDLSVHDIFGNELLRKNYQSHHDQQLLLDLNNYGTGVYFIRIKTRSEVFVGKVMR